MYLQNECAAQTQSNPMETTMDQENGNHINVHTNTRTFNIKPIGFSRQRTRITNETFTNTLKICIIHK